MLVWFKRAGHAISIFPVSAKQMLATWVPGMISQTLVITLFTLCLPILYLCLPFR